MVLAHEVAPPDLEAHLVALVKPLGGCRVWQYDTGSSWPHVAERSSVQIDVRASTKERARARAYKARGVVLGLPWASWDSGVVVKVEVIAGPLWEPDEDGAPRYVVRAAVTYRPRRWSA